jgi:hypothetical protein
MPAPWEKYQAATDSAPWTKYGTAPTPEMGWGEYLGRGATDALPVAGMMGGGLLGSAAAPVAGSLAGAGLGYAGGEEAKGLLNHYLFGDELPDAAPTAQAARVGANVLEGVAGEMGGQVLNKGLGLLPPLKNGLLSRARPGAAPGLLEEVGNGAIDQRGIGARSVARPAENAGALPTLATTPPLAGLPQSSPGPTEEVRAAARQYAKERGVVSAPHVEYAKAEPERGARIAQAYEEMIHDPNHPEVKRAYDALIKETMDQWQLMKKMGIKVDIIQPGMPNPYPNGSPDMIKDVRGKHLWVFPTESGFGSGEAANHPLLTPVGEKLGNHDLLANDVFRAVHDVFGHAKEGVGFGPHGEENAWRSHVGMFSPEAQKAMTSETRGQNSWVNFGPHGEANQANPINTVYAEQKAGLLPDWAMKEGLESATKTPKRNIVISPVIDEVASFRKMLPRDAGQDIDQFVGKLKAINKGGKVSPQEVDKVRDLIQGVLENDETGPQLRRAAVLAQDALRSVSAPKAKIKADPFFPKAKR